MAMWRPERSKIGTLHSGRGRPASNCQERRISTSYGDHAFSSACGIASRACGMPVQLECAAAYTAISSMETASEYIAMSRATTAIRSSDA